MDVPLKKIREDVWEVPQSYKDYMRSYKDYMRVPARIYAAEGLLAKIKGDLTLQQTINVAALPGIEKYSLVMPDGHQGYGFPIGGVAATDFEEGVISPGGVGYDINCGVRLIRTNLKEEDVRPHLSDLLDSLFEYIPAGLGLSGKVMLSNSQLDEVLRGGTEWCVENDYGWEEDQRSVVRHSSGRSARAIIF
jgi:tRNA-splicing ligase RtcB